MNRLSSRNNRLKLEASRNLPIDLEESIEIYLKMNESIKTGRCQHVTGWIQDLDRLYICPNNFPRHRSTLLLIMRNGVGHINLQPSFQQKISVDHISHFSRKFMTWVIVLFFDILSHYQYLMCTLEDFMISQWNLGSWTMDISTLARKLVWPPYLFPCLFGGKMIMLHKSKLLNYMM